MLRCCDAMGDLDGQMSIWSSPTARRTTIWVSMSRMTSRSKQLRSYLARYCRTCSGMSASRSERSLRGSAGQAQPGSVARGFKLSCL